MKQHTIEIEGLPDGWEAVAYRHIRSGDEHVLIEGEIRAASNVNNLYEQLIVKKKQPRRNTQTDDAASRIHECIEQLKLEGVCNHKIITALLGEAHGLSEERKE